MPQNFLWVELTGKYASQTKNLQKILKEKQAEVWLVDYEIISLWRRFYMQFLALRPNFSSRLTPSFLRRRLHSACAAVLVLDTCNISTIRPCLEMLRREHFQAPIILHINTDVKRHSKDSPPASVTNAVGERLFDEEYQAGPSLRIWSTFTI